MKVLRDDQAHVQRELFQAWNTGKRNNLIVVPTGGGKSVIVSDTVKKFDNSNRKTLVTAHRQELVSQMSLHMAEQEIRHALIAPPKIVSAIKEIHRETFGGRCFVVPEANTHVGGIDTILSRLGPLSDFLSKLDLFTIDEAHHVLRENKWGKVANACGRALGLGVTASPERADGKGLGIDACGIYENMILGPSQRWLIDRGFLSDYEIVVPETDYRSDLLKIGSDGEYTAPSMEAASENSQIVGDCVTEYIKHAYGKRGVCFVTDLKIAEKVAAKFNAYGVPAAVISSETPDPMRIEYIKRLKSGKLKILVNKDILGEGFDLPAIEVVIMARPTASLAVYLQQFGRVLRTMPGKLFGLVIDLVSNIKRHGFPDKQRLWTLSNRENRGKKQKDPEEVPVIICRAKSPNPPHLVCSKPYEAVHAVCPHCGQAQPITKREGERVGPEEVDGDLVRIDAATLAEMRKAIELPSPDFMADRAVYAGHHAGVVAGQRNIAEANITAQQELKDMIALWAGYQRSLGRDDRQSYMRFYHATGVDVLSALALERSKMIKLTETIKGWLPQ